MLDRSTIRGKHLTPLQARVLLATHTAPRAPSTEELAVLVYGDEEVARRKLSLCATIQKIIVALHEAGFTSYHLRMRRSVRPGRGAHAVWSCTQSGAEWLNYHQEHHSRHTPKAPSKWSKPSKRYVPAAAPAPAPTAAPVVFPAPPASIDLRRYAHRPLPLRVRKAVNMPAHYWR